MPRNNNPYKRQDPAYRFYTSDFAFRNQFMTDEQVGKYIRILCYQHQNGHLTEAEMLFFCKGKDEVVFSKFLKDEQGLYYNEEMENEINRRIIVSESKTKNVNKRWDQNRNKKQPTNKIDTPKQKPDPMEQYKGKIDTHIPEYDDT